MIKKHKNKGFSLLEIVVAVSILIILTSIVIPTYIQIMQDSRMDMDRSKFESMCTAFKKALSESEVQKEVNDIGGDDDLTVIFYIGEEGQISFLNGYICGSKLIEPLRSSKLWENSFQSIDAVYGAESNEFYGQYLMFTLTPKTTTTTAKCEYVIIDALPIDLNGDGIVNQKDVGLLKNGHIT